jgi:hypothetical protein
MFFFRRKARIEFLCRPQDKGVIAEPVPAKALLPDWFRRLPAVSKQHLSATSTGSTIKRCMPFLDALSAGWIIPLAATVRLEIRDDGKTVNAGWEFDREMVSYHGLQQVAGNPREPRPPCKFPPVNRPHPVFEALSGVVDTDTYHAFINFPFFATAPDGLYVIEKGTPIVQVIPFRRGDVQIEGVVRSETPEEAETRERIFRATNSGECWYRNEARAPR